MSWFPASRAARLLPALTVVFVACEPTFIVEAEPTLLSPPFSPGLVCQEQNGPEGTALVLRGDGLSPTTVDVPNDPKVVLPALALTRAAELDGSASADGADVIAVSGTRGGDNADLLSWTSQQEMALRVLDSVDLGDADGPLPQGLYDLTVTLADQQTVSSAQALAVVERPHVLNVDPPLLCLDQGDRTITIGARGALVVDGAVPTVTVGSAAVVPVPGGCVDIPQAAQAASVCDSLTVTLLQGSLEDGPQAIALQNPAPADCSSVDDNIDVVVVPPPAIVSVSPAAVCADAGVVELTVTGSGFLVIDDVAFSVAVNGAAVTPVPGGCTPITVNGGVGGAGVPVVQSCTSFSISVDTATLPVGGVAIAVENPAPAGCNVDSRAFLRVDPVPLLSAVDPAGVCEGSGVITVDVSGDGFAILDGEVFTVTVGGVAGTVVGAPAGCVDVDVGVAGVVQQSCTSFTVSVDATTLPSGAVDVAVTNPGPDACAGNDDTLFAVAPAPVITSVTPEGVCVVGASVVDVVVAGRDFLVVDGASFVVTVEGAVRPVTPAGCVAVTDVPGRTVQSCTSFALQIDATGLPAGDLDIVVDNPDLPGCFGTASAPFALLSPPTVTAVLPEAICSDVASSFTIIGTGLSTASTVLIGDRVPDSQVANADGTTLTVTFDAGLPAGDYPISVSNGTGCDAASNLSLTVNPTPLVFFVNPPVTFNGIAIEATVFASGLASLPAAVEIVDASGAATALAFADSGRDGRVLATVPDGLTPGDYAVRVTSEFQCRSVIDGALEVTDALTLAIGSIDPGFASPTVPTSVTLRTLDPIPAGQEGFENVPQVYLTPSDGTGTALALRAVELVDANTLNAVVTGAGPGVYDVVVVNPSGAVGLLPGALTVTVAEPPRVTSVAPGSLDANSVSTVTVFGAKFAVAGPTVDLECQDFTTGAPLVVSGAITVTTATATSLDVTVDGTGIPAGAVCVVVVENPDGAIARFSALSFKTSSQNLNEWRPASPMVEARRAPVFAAGRPTDTSRFVYAIGGDAGAVASAKTSVEAAPVDAFGEMGAWTLQRNTLQNAVVAGVVTPSPRTQAGVATVGRYIYVVGGDNGAGAQSTVLRAQILDPLAGPEILDLSANLGVVVDGVAEGLPVGLWIYRVAAVFPLSDADNPGGESLGGELFNVDLPDLGDDRLVLELTWQAVPGATGYRLYRSPVPDVGPERLELLTTTTGTSFVDDGGPTTPATVIGATPPLPAGSTGVWHAVSSLLVPRAAHATVAVPNPTNAAQFFLYAAGGRTTAGVVVGSGEVATITIAADGRQSISTWRPLTASLSVPRAELVGLAITPADTPAAGTDSFVFFTSGRRGNGTLAGVVEGAKIGVNGDLAALTLESDPNPARSGAGGFSANGFLFLFGGANGGASNNDVSTVLIDNAPTLDNWNGLGGGGMLVPRRFIGTAQESAFFFLGGGEDDTGAVLNTVEQTIQ